jgi:hypothetical protein
MKVARAWSGALSFTHKERLGERVLKGQWTRAPDFSLGARLGQGWCPERTLENSHTGLHLNALETQVASAFFGRLVLSAPKGRLTFGTSLTFSALLDIALHLCLALGDRVPFKPTSLQVAYGATSSTRKKTFVDPSTSPVRSKILVVDSPSSPRTPSSISCAQSSMSVVY